MKQNLKLVPGTKLLTYDEASERLGVESKRTFLNLVNKGVLNRAIVRVPGMRPKVREDELNRLIEENTLEAV